MSFRYFAPAISVLLMLSVVSCSDSMNKGVVESEPALAEVAVITLNPEPVPVVVHLPGRTSASEVAEVRPQVRGIIEKKMVEEGSEVKAGDLLYKIDSRQYQAELNAAKASLAHARAAVPIAELKVERFSELASARSVSKEELEQAKATLAQARADVSRAMAAVDAAQIDMDNTRVVAPIDGSVGRSAVNQGSLVTANQADALITIRKLNPLYVDLSSSSNQILELRKAIQRGSLLLSEFPRKVRMWMEDGEAHPELGSLVVVEPFVGATTDSVSIRVNFPNSDNVLLPGMFVRGEIMLGNEVGAYLLPQRSVSRNAKGQAFAYFVDSDNRVETRLLKAERAYKTNWVVSKGVNPGDRLIVEGMQHVAKGDEVIALPAKVTELGLVELLPTRVPVAVLESAAPNSADGAVLSKSATAESAVKVGG